MVGVPQLPVKYVVLGGKYVTNVVGAVPVIDVAGLVVAVPPVITSVEPTGEPPGSTQVVVNVNTVDVAEASI